MQALEAARHFNATWDPDIQLLRHDCHHHTAELVQALTGDKFEVWRTVPFPKTDTVAVMSAIACPRNF